MPLVNVKQMSKLAWFQINVPGSHFWYFKMINTAVAALCRQNIVLCYNEH